MTRMLLTAATRLIHLGHNLRLVEQRGDEVDWSCDRTRTRFTFTHAQLAEMIGDSSASFQTSGGKHHDEIAPEPDLIDPERRAAAERKLEYVLAVHRAGLAYRPKASEFSDNIAATARSLGDDAPPEVWTAKRWVKRAGDKPTWWRLLDREDRKGNRSLRIDDEQTAIIDAQIDQRYLKRPPISIETLLPYVRNAVNVANAGRAEGDRIAHVGRAAVTSVLARRDPRSVHAARYGEQAARDAWDRVVTQTDPEAPLDRIEIDHTRADLFVVSDEDGLPIGRPTIGFAIDRCTRMPFGIYVGFEPESVLTVMQILKNGIFPKTYVANRIASGEWDFKHDWPAWGMPRGLVFDRGMAGLSNDLRQAALEIGIRDVTFTSAKSGRQKGAIERYFRRQNRDLLHNQRGTSLSNVVDRKDYDSSKNAVIPFSDLIRMVHRYLVDIYPHRPHAGLNGRLPALVWQRAIERHPSDPVMPIEQLVHLFTRSKTVTLLRTGVRLHSVFYNSAELDAERTSADFAQRCPDRQVLLRYDPADMSAIWVRLPHRGDRYVRVPPDRAWSDYAHGRSVWEHLQVRAHHLATVGGEFDADAAAAAHARLAQDADDASRRTRKIRTSARRARMDGVGRQSPAGADGSTSPPGSSHSRRTAAGKPPPPANDQKPVGGPPAGPPTATGRRRGRTVSLGPGGKP